MNTLLLSVTVQDRPYSYATLMELVGGHKHPNDTYFYLSVAGLATPMCAWELRQPRRRIKHGDP